MIIEAGCKDVKLRRKCLARKKFSQISTNPKVDGIELPIVSMILRTG